MAQTMIMAGKTILMGQDTAKQVEQKLDEIYQILQSWIHSVLNGVQVSFACPRAQDGHQVDLYLLDLIQGPSSAYGSRMPSLEIGLRFLVSVNAETPKEANSMVCALAFAALEKPEFEVKIGESLLPFWTSCGVTPRPCFQLVVPLRLEREAKAAPRIRKPPEVRGMAMRRLNGLVVGPDGLPLPNARVELPSIQFATATDAKGRFLFSAVPIEPHTKQFRIRARSRERLIALELPKREDELLTIYFDVLE